MSLTIALTYVVAVGIETEGDRYADLLQNAAPADNAEGSLQVCRSNGDCRTQGDEGATCDLASSQCVCSSTQYTGATCYGTPTNPTAPVLEQGTMVWTFLSGLCNLFEAIPGGEEPFRAAINEVFGSGTFQTLCGSVSFVVQIPNLDVRNITNLYNDATNRIAALAASSNYSTVLAYTAGSPIMGSYHPDTSKSVPSCVVLDATKEIVLNGVCRALECRAGYRRKDYYVNSRIVSSCELITKTDDDTLSNTAIVGIVIGGLILVLLIGYVIWHFCVREEPEPYVEKENSPYGDDEEQGNNNNGSDNNPYGDASEQQAVATAAKDDVVV